MIGITYNWKFIPFVCSAPEILKGGNKRPEYRQRSWERMKKTLIPTTNESIIQWNGGVESHGCRKGREEQVPWQPIHPTVALTQGDCNYFAKHPLERLNLVRVWSEVIKCQWCAMLRGVCGVLLVLLLAKWLILTSVAMLSILQYCIVP